MSEPHIDTSRIRRKYEMDQMDAASIGDHTEQNELDADAKNSCVLM